MIDNSQLATPFFVHPFRILHIFFPKICIERTDLPIEGDISCQLLAEIGLGAKDEEDRYHTNLRVRTQEAEECHLQIEIIAVGVFEFLGDGIPNDEVFTKFVNENLLVALSSRIIQLIATLTTQMGIPPIWMQSPRGFGFDIEEMRAATSKE
jgi:hypothetical protein